MKIINRWICKIVGLYRSVCCRANVDGCDLVEQEVDIPALVTVSQCEVCGRYSIGWKKMPLDPKEGL